MDKLAFPIKSPSLQGRWRGFPAHEPVPDELVVPEVLWPVPDDPSPALAVVAPVPLVDVPVPLVDVPALPVEVPVLPLEVLPVLVLPLDPDESPVPVDEPVPPGVGGGLPEDPSPPALVGVGPVSPEEGGVIGVGPVLPQPGGAVGVGLPEDPGPPYAVPVPFGPDGFPASELTAAGPDADP